MLISWTDLSCSKSCSAKQGASKSSVADLGQQYTSTFLGSVRTQVKMGVIP